MSTTDLFELIQDKHASASKLQGLHDSMTTEHGECKSLNFYTFLTPLTD